MFKTSCLLGFCIGCLLSAPPATAQERAGSRRSDSEDAAYHRGYDPGDFRDEQGGIYGNRGVLMWTDRYDAGDYANKFWNTHRDNVYAGQRVWNANNGDQQMAGRRQACKFSTNKKEVRLGKFGSRWGAPLDDFSRASIDWLVTTRGVAVTLWTLQVRSGCCWPSCSWSRRW